MREFTKREKSLSAVVGSIVIIIIASRFVPSVFQGFSGGEIAEKHEQLQATKNLIQLAKFAEQVEEKLRTQVGLQGQIISDSLFEEISRDGNLETFNRARGTSDLIALHPALEGKAATLIAYKQQHGELETVDALRDIRGPIFEGEQPQVVISQRISQLAKNSGLKPDYQLNIKPSPGKTVGRIPPQAKQNFVLYLYLNQLDTELKWLRAQQNEELVQREDDTEEKLENAMFDGWWGDAPSPQATNEDSKDGDLETKTPPKVTGKGKVQSFFPLTDKLSESESKTETRHESGPYSEIRMPVSEDGPKEKPQPMARTSNEVFESESEIDEKQALNPRKGPNQTQLHFNYDSEIQNRPFAQLPELIPASLRMQLIKFISARVKLEMVGAVEFKKSFIADQIVRLNDELRRGSTKFESTTTAIQIRFRTNSILLAKFEELGNQYEEEQLYTSGESTEHHRDYEEQIIVLTEYVDRIQQQMEQLQDWFGKVNSTYHPKTFSVEMKFKSEVGTVVRLIQSVESSTKWLRVKNIRLTNHETEKKKSRLAVDLSMTAKIL